MGFNLKSREQLYYEFSVREMLHTVSRVYVIILPRELGASDGAG